MSDVVFEEWISTDQCARCGGAHEINIKELGTPILDYTHWALCPVTGEPIIIKFEVYNE